MAITTATSFTNKQHSFRFNLKILHFYCGVTGDGTGGTILVENELSPFIPLGSKVWLMDAQSLQNSANTEHLTQAFNEADWTSIVGTIFHGWNTYHLQTVISVTGTPYFMQPSLDLVKPVPYFLGNPTGSVITWNCRSDTNTNTKSYQWILRLLVDSPIPTNFNPQIPYIGGSGKTPYDPA